MYFAPFYSIEIGKCAVIEISLFLVSIYSFDSMQYVLLVKETNVRDLKRRITFVHQL